MAKKDIEEVQPKGNDRIGAIEKKLDGICAVLRMLKSGAEEHWGKPFSEDVAGSRP